MVSTEKFHLTPVSFFKILLNVYIRRRWWLMAFIIIMGLINAVGDYKSGTFFIVFAVLYPLLVLFQLWRFANSPENRNFLIERYYEINNDEIRIFSSDGSNSTLKLSVFTKAIILPQYYLLYVSKTQFLIVPKRSFTQPSEKDWFERNIANPLFK